MGLRGGWIVVHVLQEGGCGNKKKLDEYPSEGSLICSV